MEKLVCCHFSLNSLDLGKVVSVMDCGTGEIYALAPKCGEMGRERSAENEVSQTVYVRQRFVVNQ